MLALDLYHKSGDKQAEFTCCMLCGRGTTNSMILEGKSLISIADYTKKDWLAILKIAQEFEKKPPGKLLISKVIACLFFEPSTRTRLSFESAILQLGGGVVGFSEAGSSSAAKGESLKDTIRTISNYADLIVMRHPLEGSARLAKDYASVPVINGGDGANQHPTQTLLDLYSILKTQGTLDGLTVAFLADLKYSRTVHSLVHALSEFNCSFIFISPPQLRMPDNLRFELKNKRRAFVESNDLRDALGVCDILYANRIQKERFADPLEYEQVKNSLRLTKKMLARTKPNLKILDPLPRVNEIAEDVDDDKRAYYFAQTKNGIYTRQALISAILGVAK